MQYSDFHSYTNTGKAVLGVSLKQTYKQPAIANVG